mmetsp:Transcript_74412/g.199802  ORF Transcript_74412/g.199802 Transcript_74412/m.199802 type:complete len:355 (+) Transcript_74412:120-1184(+)
MDLPGRRRILWGKSGERDVHLVTIGNDKLEVDVCELGAALVAVRVKKSGAWVDVALGYESLERYTGGGKPNFGTAVGRCANRIAGAAFELDGQTYELEKNNGPNHLHGGTEGFYSQVFSGSVTSETTVRLTASEPDGAMGYPGQVDLTVVYEVVGNELHFRYSGSTSRPTLLSMTNHTYWNLKGHAAGNVLDHSLMVAGSRTTEVDGSLAITGRCPGVEGTPLDLRAAVPTLLQDAVDAAGPIDVNYCLVDDAAGWRPGGPEVLAARLVGPHGITMEVWTDQPGLQVFTGHNIDPENGAWWHGKGATWQKFGAVCLEPQLWPDGIHHPSFPSPVLRAGETYTHHSHHAFIVEGE